MPPKVKAELFNLALMYLCVGNSCLTRSLIVLKQYTLASCLFAAVIIAFLRVNFGLGKGGADAS